MTKSFLRPVAPVEDKLKLDHGAKGNRFRAREEIAALIGPWIRERPL